MAVRFDADTDVLTTTTGLFTGDVCTVLCWGRIAVDRNDYSNFVSLQTSLGRKVSLTLDSDGTTLRAFDDELAGPTGISLTVGTWYAIAAVVNGTTCDLYWGTSPYSLSTNSDSGFVTSAGATTQMLLGNNLFGFYLDGDLANVKLYDAALSAAEVSAGLIQYVPLRTANLLHWYPLLNVNLTDFSGNGNSLTAGGSATAFAAGPPIPWTVQPPIQPATAGRRASLI